MKCYYNCGKEAKYQLKNGNWICSKSPNSCEVNKKKNSNKIKLAHKEGKLLGWNELNKNGKLNRGWSKGLTKDTDIRVKKISNSLKGKPVKGYPHTEKTKQILSQKRISYLEHHNNYGVKWYSIGDIKVQGTWEKKVAEFLIKNKIKFIRKKIKFQHRQYTPDFYLPEYDLYIEVKGFMRERDKRKMFLVLHYNNIDLRLIEKNEFKNINEYKDIINLPKFIDRYKIDDIDFSKFNDVWASDGNGIPY